MGYFNHLMARGCQECERLRTSFQTSWLPSPWSGADQTSADGRAERLEQTPPFAGVGSTLMELRLPLPQGLDAGFETDSARRAFDGVGCVDDQPTHSVIGNEVHQAFFLYQGGGSASQHIHPHGRLDVAEEQFESPRVWWRL
ncbi:hypothetical protein DNK49_21405 [Azoarcus communis]|uniref:Uncharacterized protein n=1 Tax=Parazoarcus communis SWub3 = DSM 12120 TaxID=1121029 RepID=A0A323UTK9_9RHOO|nr:hypothetical protein DNK49_21405 [Azoarcus communis] [Parazoarcus communis SWub3 = DSM 12120]